MSRFSASRGILYSAPPGASGQETDTDAETEAAGETGADAAVPADD